MAFVFYDLETSGTNTRFDQILQFAAIRTDADLVEIERFELRCRLDAHIVPHPEALTITRRTVAEVFDQRLPSHYEFMCRIARLIENWSPAVFTGFNSIRFDEEMLRHSLYRTLHNPYLTSLNNNVRADALTLARAVAFFSPGTIAIPRDDEGKPRFKLAMLNEANGGPSVEAHSAMGDVEATLALCRLVRDRDESCWSRFLRFASKKATAALIDQDGPFGVVRFRGNEPRPTCATLLGMPDDRNVRMCLDLTADLDALAAASDEQIALLSNEADSPFLRLRINGCPCVCELWDLPDEARPNLSDDYFEQRAERVAADPRLRARIVSVLAANPNIYPPVQHVEELLYDALPPREDDDGLRAFHKAPWDERHVIISALSDSRWRRLGTRLLYLEAPHVLNPDRVESMNDMVAKRHYAVAARWTTIPSALASIDARPGCYPIGLREQIQRIGYLHSG